MAAEWAQSAPDYLIPIPQYGWIVCTQHGCGFTSKNLQEHLLYKHHLKKRFWPEMEQWIKVQNLAQEVGRLLDYSLPIEGLPLILGWCYNVDSCLYYTASKERQERYISEVHYIESRKKQ